MASAVHAVIGPLVERKLFATEEDAVRALLRDYMLRQIAKKRRTIVRFEKKYGMRFEPFSKYLHERSVLLQSDELSSEQRQILGRAIMMEEEDGLDWKVARDMLESWLGLRQEVDR